MNIEVSTVISDDNLSQIHQAVAALFNKLCGDFLVKELRSVYLAVDVFGAVTDFQKKYSPNNIGCSKMLAVNVLNFLMETNSIL